MDWNKASGLSGIGNFILALVVVVLMVIPMVWPRPAPEPQDPSLVQQMFHLNAWWLAAIVVGMLVAGALHVTAASISRRKPGEKTEKGCASEWLHGIARDQAEAIDRWVFIRESGFQLHDLLREDSPFVEFNFYMSNESVYDISFTNLGGEILFGSHLLNGEVRWSDEPDEVEHGRPGQITIRQMLSKSDAARILSTTDPSVRFHFDRLKIIVKGGRNFESIVQPKRLRFLDQSLIGEGLLVAYGVNPHREQPAVKPSPKSPAAPPQPQYAKFKPVPEPEPRGSDVPRSYTEDRFGTGPIWRWRYSEVAGDLTPLNIQPRCPECNGAMTLLERALKEERENGDHLYHVKVHCRSHPGNVYGELGNFDGSDYPEIRSQIQEKLQNGGWHQAILKNGY